MLVLRVEAPDALYQHLVDRAHLSSLLLLSVDYENLQYIEEEEEEEEEREGKLESFV